jgi:hypothetical protein
MPNVGNLNDNPGLNVANSVIVQLSGGVAGNIFSNVGSCNVILDVAGYIL